MTQPQQPDLDAVARAILDANHYMTLGTADADGRPWVSPVFFAADRYRDLYWISSPEATHSRNLAARPELSIVVFDSQAPVGTGQAVYMAATAAELSGAELDQGLQVYPGERGLAAGARAKTPPDVLAPSLYRLYRATSAPTGSSTRTPPPTSAPRSARRPPGRGQQVDREPEQLGHPLDGPGGVEHDGPAHRVARRRSRSPSANARPSTPTRSTTSRPGPRSSARSCPGRWL